MAKRQLVPAAGGAGLRLARGEHLRIIDLEGGQTGDLMAFSRDGRERLSNGRTFDYGGKFLSIDRRCSVVRPQQPDADDCRGSSGPARLSVFAVQSRNVPYPVRSDRLSRELPRQPALGAAGARDRAGFSADGVQFLHERRRSPRWVPQFAPPKCRAGDSMVLRAEMDLAIALSACPASTCNGGAPPRPLSFEIPGDERGWRPA